MKSDRIGKQVVVVFLLALAGYAALYSAIEHRRTRNGPWQVAFTTTTNGPTLTINQPAIGVTNIQIIFPDAAPAPTDAAAQVFAFAAARPVPFDLPFGQCIFQDTTFLPGTVALKIFGHEIQLIPRVLTLDDVEHPWHSGEIIFLTNAPVTKTIGR